MVKRDALQAKFKPRTFFLMPSLIVLSCSNILLRDCLMLPWSLRISFSSVLRSLGWGMGGNGSSHARLNAFRMKSLPSSQNALINEPTCS